jgi:hypothetical protein
MVTTPLGTADYDDSEIHRDAFYEAMYEILGGTSPEAYRTVSQLSQTYDRMLAAYMDGGGKLTEDAYFKIIPARVFELAASLKWISYFLEREGPEDIDFPFPTVDSCCVVLPTTGWRIEPHMWDAFMRVLPIEQYADVYPIDPSGAVGKEWKHPTPKELVDGFLNKRLKGGPRRTQTWLAIQMLRTDGYGLGEHAARQFIKLRRIEPPIKKNQRSTPRGKEQARVLRAVFKRHDPKEYADLQPEHFYWTVEE